MDQRTRAEARGGVVAGRRYRQDCLAALVQLGAAAAEGAAEAQSSRLPY